MWLQLTPDLILSRVVGPEKAALDSAAKDAAQFEILSDVAALVSSEWRGAIARAVPIDKRRGFVPDELMIHILADFRYRAATRIPNIKALLDDRRVKEWERANKVRDDLLGTFAIEPPEDAAPSNNAPLMTVPPSIFD